MPSNPVRQALAWTTIAGCLFLAAAPEPVSGAPQTAQAPLAGEATVRRLIDGLARGEPPYEEMTDGLAGVTRAQIVGLQERIAALGAVRSVTPLPPAASGPPGSRFDVRFERGALEFAIALDPQGKIAGANFRPMPGVAQPPPPPVEKLSDDALAGFIRDRMERMNYSGAVLYARQGRPVVIAARGLADREANLPNTEDSLFRVGSMNKMFTATAILQLVQAGKVRLDAPFGTYLKDYPNAEMARGVTVHHLLTHTGGVGDIFGPQFTLNRLQLKTLKDYVNLYGARPAQFAPGTRYAYANYGFVLLGRIIEEVSGQSYPDYVRDHILQPAGMTRTGFVPEDVAVAGRTKGYMLQGANYVSNVNTLPYSGTSAGGGYTTVRDLLAFSTALTGGKLLDAEHLRLMTSKKANGSYAYGFQDMSRDGLRIYGHGGNAPGMNGNLWIIGDGQAVIAALSNVEPPSGADALLADIARRGRFARPDGSLATILEPGPPPATEAERMALLRANDPDGDGKIDKAGYRKILEIMAYGERLDTLFAQRDVDKDGLVSTEEYLAVIPQ